jgi:hypothetical protein
MRPETGSVSVKRLPPRAIARGRHLTAVREDDLPHDGQAEAGATGGRLRDPSAR